LSVSLRRQLRRARRNPSASRSSDSVTRLCGFGACSQAQPSAQLAPSAPAGGQSLYRRRRVGFTALEIAQQVEDVARVQLIRRRRLGGFSAL
jgi:hypothetical protein